MKKCLKCGMENPEDHKFCLSCGASLEEKQSKFNEIIHNKKIVFGIIGIVLVLLLCIAGSQTSVQEVTLEYSSATLDLGARGKIEAEIKPENASNKKLIWSSSNTDVATVDEEGYITSKSIGTTTITVRTSNGKKASCELSIVQPGPDFVSIYNTYLDSSYASVAQDGSYLEIDTNPNDYDDYSDVNAIQGLVNVIYLLDLPDSLIREMSSTRALDGRLSKTYDEVSVSWSYHPDNGLEVLFTTN